MRYIYLFLLIIGLSTNRSAAQTVQFLEGSFELTFDTVGCIPLPDTLLSHLLGRDVRNIGANGRVYHGDTSCAQPADGDHFLGLYDDGGTQEGAFSMVLSNPMIPTNLYKITYFARGMSTLLPAIDIEIGYSTDTGSFGLTATRIPAPAGTNWTMQTVYFRPNNAAQYITVQGMSNTPNVDSGMIWLDDFSIVDATNISAAAGIDKIEIMPNPARDYVIITGSMSMGRDATISVKDIAGHVMNCKPDVKPNGDMVVDVSSLAEGMYFLNITDNKANVVRKIVVAR